MRRCCHWRTTPLVTTWGGQTAASTPTYQTGQTPNGGPAVQFNGTDRMGDNVSVPASSAQDWIYVAVIKPVNVGAYHNLVDDDIGNRPMLWIDGANRYEMNFGGGSAPAAGTGTGGWDIVIADSRLNQIYVNGATVSGTGGGSVSYPAALSFDFFHRDGGASFQGQVAEVQSTMTVQPSAAASPSSTMSFTRSGSPQPRPR